MPAPYPTPRLMERDQIPGLEAELNAQLRLVQRV